MFRLVWTSAILIFCCVVPAIGQNSEKADISVQSIQVEGMVGESLVYEIRETIRESSGLNLVDSDQSYFRIIVSAMPKYENNPATATIYSIQWVLYSEEEEETGLPFLIDTTMGYCGSQAVENSARNIAARTDQLMSDIRQYVRALEQQNRR